LIIRDLNLVMNSIFVNTLGTDVGDTMLLPLVQYSYIASTPRSSTSDTTILEFFLKSNPFVKMVDWLNQLKDAGGAGIDYMVAYKRDPEVLQLRIPSDFEQLEPEKRNLEYIIDCLESFGGVEIYYPLCVSYGSGI